MYMLVLGSILLNLCNAAFPASNQNPPSKNCINDRGTIKPFFCMNKSHDALAETAKKQEAATVAHAIDIRQELDNKLRPAITDMVIEMLVDPQHYLWFDSKNIWDSYKKKAEHETGLGYHTPSAAPGVNLWILTLQTKTTRQAVYLRVKQNQNSELEGRVDHCNCPSLDHDCYVGSCKQLIQSWPLAAKRAHKAMGLKAYLKKLHRPTVQSMSCPTSTPYMLVKRDAPNSSVFTIDSIQDFDGKADNNLIEALVSIDSSRFGRLINRREINKPELAQGVLEP